MKHAPLCRSLADVSLVLALGLLSGCPVAAPGITSFFACASDDDCAPEARCDVERGQCTVGVAIVSYTDGGVRYADGGASPPDAGVPLDGGGLAGDSGAPEDDAGVGPDGGSQDAGDADLPPLAQADEALVDEDGSVLVAVLENDVDPEDLTLTLARIDPPASGMAVIEGGNQVRYTPSPDFFGEDAFRYTVTDPMGNSAEADVVVTVAPVNDAPTLTSQVIVLASGAPYLGQLLADDVDGDALTYSIVTPPPAGTVDLDEGTGELTYTPPAVAGSVEEMTFEVSDGALASAPATLVVYVADKVWTGALDTVWSTADNWAPSGAPETTSVVWLPSDAARQPALYAATACHTLLLDEGATLDTRGFTLTLAGSVLAGDPTTSGASVVGTGTIVLTGQSAFVSGWLPSLTVEGAAQLDGDGVLTGSLTLAQGSTLRLAGNRLSVQGAANIDIGASGEGLVLEDGDELDVRGAFLIETYAPVDTGPRFRGGVLRVGGNFDEGSPQGTQAFVGNRTLVILDGSAPQTVIFDDPVPGASRFGDVEIHNAAGVSFTTNVVIDGQLRVVGDGALSGGQAMYLSRLPLTSARYSVTTSTVRGAISAEGDTTLHGGTWRIDGDGSLRLGGHALTLRGALVSVVTAAPGSGLWLTSEDDRLIVDGNVTFDGSGADNSSDGKLSAGTLVVRGNFRQTSAAGTSSFMPTGAGVTFAGSGAIQSVIFDDPRDDRGRFWDVRIDPGARVAFNTSATPVLGSFSMADDAIASGPRLDFYGQVPETSGGYAVLESRLRGRITLDGDRVVHGGTLRLDDGGALALDGHTLTVRGHLYQRVLALDDGLLLEEPGDEVVVHGNATFNGTSSGDTSARFAGGTLRVLGNFSQISDGGTATFIASGTRVILDGTLTQTVAFVDPGADRSRFYDLEVRNPVNVVVGSAAAGPYLDGSLHVAAGGRLSGGDVYLTGALPVTAGRVEVARIHVVGPTTLTADVALTLPALSVDVGGSIALAGHTLVVDGTFSQQSGDVDDGVHLSGPDDLLILQGDASFDTTASGTTAATLTGGTLVLHKSFTQLSTGGNQGFAPTGTVVRVAGAQLQTLSFTDAALDMSRFHDVVIDNPTGVRFTTATFTSGDVEVSGRMEVAAGVTVDIGGALDVNASGELQNDGTVWYTTAATLEGTLGGNAPMQH